MDTQRFKQLQQEYEQQKNEKDKIDTLVEMALEVRNYDVDRTAEMADEIIRRSEKIKYRRGVGRGYNLKGSCYWLQGEYDIALEILQEAYAIATEIADRKLEARVLNNLGNIYRDLGDLASALNYFESALAINEELGDELAQSVNLTSISNLHFDLTDYDSALEYAQKCLPIFERAHDGNRLLTIYYTLGNIYFKQEQFEEALGYFRHNLEKSEEGTAAHVMAVSGMGKVYYKKGDFDNAKRHLLEALDHSQELENAEVQIIAHYYLGRVYMDEGGYTQAEQHLQSALMLAEEYTRRHDIMSVHEGLSQLYDKLGNIEKSFHHLKTYEKLKEEIFKQTTFNKLRNLQIRQQIELAQKEKEVAERTAYLKQQFMANMSHEIRTPMNAIVGMTRLLIGKEERPEQLRYLNAIRQSADNLLVIINDILDLSKIEAGKIVIEHTGFSIREVAQSVSDMLMLKAEEKNIELRVHVAGDVPDRLVGDPTRVHQVLVNLVGNAVKFTEKGYVELYISIQQQEGSKFLLRFDVTDTGIGIAPDYVEKIFDSFTQAGTDVARRFGGTGLGLTISRQLVTLMQGDISVKSELGKGTVFTVIIPFELSQEQAGEKKIFSIDDPAIQRLNNAKVLLVEDNEFNRMVAEETLRDLLPLIQIEVAVNGEEAVKMVEKNSYDLLLMDIQMPVMDGVTATRTIREKLKAPASNVKIIAMTANVLQEDVQKYLAAGMNAYVSKPFHTDELLLKMSAVIEGKSVTDSGSNGQIKKASEDLAPLPDKVTDMQFLNQFTGGKEDKVSKYINMFLENTPRLLGNIDKGLEEKDYNAIKVAAHSLKPQLSYMGVKEEVSHIFLIEQTAGEAHFERLPPLVANLHRVCQKAFEELKNR